MPVDFTLFAIQAGGNLVLQSDPLRLEANTAGNWVAMTGKERRKGAKKESSDREGHGFSRAAKGRPRESIT
jgi:hypothetical protein